MLIEDISTSQILTAVLFIVVLIAAQIYITKNKNNIRNKWASNQRISLSDNTRLGPTEKVQIIKVDNHEYLYFFSKGNQPVIIPMIPGKAISSKIPNKADRRALPSSALHSHLTKTKEGRLTKPQNSDDKIIQAISTARKQNPKVSFD